MRTIVALAMAFVLLLFAPQELKEPQVRTETVEQYAKRLAVARWNTVEWHCLHILWHRESRWNPKAKNPKSSARGIPQILNLPAGTKPKAQVDRGLRYIKHRYKTPCEALSHHFRRGWY